MTTSITTPDGVSLIPDDGGDARSTARVGASALGDARVVGVIVATIALFHRLDRIAAWCLVPLACWVAYATLLNASLWWLN